MDNNFKKIILIAVILSMFSLLINIFLADRASNISLQEKNNNYIQVLNDIRNNRIERILLQESQDGTRNLTVFPINGKQFTIVAPRDPDLVGDLLKHNVALEVIPPQGPNLMISFLLSWGPMLLLLGFWLFYMKKMGGGKGLFSFNKSKAKLINPKDIKETFADVVGCDEAKFEVKEFVDFLKNPQKFAKVGGKTPRGVLFSGPSGTGKTLLARALAKESGVPFFAVSGSDFVEMFVGTGASRVRDMFEVAKKAAPCVLFIDEIDAIGGKRGGGFGGGNEEREQTLNQILVELDGMDGNKGVILVAATNRPEVLDPALKRPGRLDRQITVDLPDVKGREQILKIHTKNMPLGKDVALSKIARGTPGFSGAELENLANEASIFAARRDANEVLQNDFEQAKDKIMMGVQRGGLTITPKDKEDTAYHESGHAIVAKLLKNSDPIYKVTIIPRGRALGVTVQLPEKDHLSYKKEYLEDKIAILMGGRAAEELFCNTFTSGASNDIAIATSIARNMVMKLGMSELGPVAFGEESGQGFLGQSGLNTNGLAQSTLEKVDLQVSKLIQKQYNLALTLLKENKDKVEAMKNALVEVETLDEDQIQLIMDGKRYDEKNQSST